MLRWLMPVAALMVGLTGLSVGSVQIAQGKHNDHAPHPGFLLPAAGDYLPDEIMVNGGSTRYFVTSISDGFDAAAYNAVSNWDSSLRNNGPNYLSKDVFTWNGYDNPYSNIFVWAVDSATHAAHCGAGYHGCLEDDNFPQDQENPPHWYVTARPWWAIMNADALGTDEIHKLSDTAHELGHAMMFGEHYGTSYNCDSIMGHSASGCGGNVITSPTSHDRNDFYYAYKPLDPPNPISMAINSSSSVKFSWYIGNIDNQSQMYWAKEDDTQGDIIDDGYLSRTSTYKTFSGLSNGDRWCFRANAFSDAGFSGLLPWGPNSLYGCASRNTGPSAGGPFVAVTYRGFSGLEIRVKNYSGGTRAMIVTGPGLGDNIGCSSQNKSSGGTYTCTSSVDPDEYNYLTWWATSGSTYSSGRVDYD